MRGRDEWKPVLKGLAGFAAGLGLWWGLTPSYDELVVKPAQMILRAVERPPVTRLRAEGREVIVDRDDFPPKSPRPGVPLSDLTFNVVLVVALFGANRETVSNRNVAGFLLACLVLYATHVLALITTVQSIYALKLGPWSEATYGTVARNAWGAAEHFYRLVGMYGIAFAIWWGLRPAGIGGIRAGRARRRASR